MSSTNFLTVKTHLSEFKNNSDKDTVSEASESGTSNSVTSAEDLQKLAVILGLNSADDVYQERFRVDRRRLETMLAENLEESQTAQAFFHQVMTETNTLVNWPARLKIGARSKKDPHVRVAGRPDDVKLAREKIMQLLDTRSNRVTMKIDVSYTDHSHIIGKGGLTIKRVMEDTGCHIHFPDSNRTSTVEKSNQVSIAGDMERVERARARVRALTPLMFCFELPIVAPSQPLPDITSPYVQQIQEQYNVQVMLRNRPKLHANLLVVKGVQWEVQATMEATNLLMNYMCGPLAKQTLVQMTLEISPMHHSVVVGRSAEQLKVIMKGTGTQIMFPDADDPNIPMIKKSCVTITGQIKDVYAARQQLVGSLPLVVIFDVPEESCRIDNDAATKLMHKHNVYINIRRKPKQGIASVVIKGIERCAGDVYEARRELLGGKEPSVTAEIPESYNIPAIANNAMPNFGVFNPFSPTHAANLANSPCSPYNIQITDLTNYANIGSPMFGHNPPTPGGYPSPMSPVALTPPVFSNTWMVPSPQPRSGQFHYPNMSVPNPNSIMYKNQGGSWNPMNNAEMNSMPQPVMMQPPYQMPADGRAAQTTLNQLLNCSSQASSGYQSNFTGSSVSLDTQNLSAGGEGSSVPSVAASVASPSVSPISVGRSPAQDDRHHEITELANIISDLPLSERRAVGCEKKTLENLNKLSPLTEYRKMRAEASKAMRETVGSGYRVPTPRWSGYYFSHTSPGPINLKDDTENNATPEKGWNRPELVRPNITEPSKTPPSKPCRYQQLYDLLRDIGLQKYIDLFKKHELDMSTFASLNEADLVEIGISAFGARRKMLLVISELQKQSNAFKKAPAPGKLISSPPFNTSHAQDKW
ncbi:protein bicaudal C homolog 1-A isoform X2 [Galleria mellonella]|uniref:Protein bicaudal C homolog 1-A isoform X2 n=1 Tax=Galleria mellonella TaxID=7137 RepID=A0ABM3MJ21_GALME|nr:protein bicaudal C homolog 1-A isoform X2 [Galleria mellonella]